MQSKLILTVLIAVSFVAGSLVTGTSAFASGDKHGKPFEEIWAAIHSLEGDVEEIDTDLEDVVFDAIEGADTMKTYIKTAGPFQKVFCDTGDFATSGGAIGEAFGRPINADGEVATEGETVTGWHNTNSGTSYVICVDVT